MTQTPITKCYDHVVIPGTERHCGLKESSRHKESTDQSNDPHMQFQPSLGSADEGLVSTAVSTYDMHKCGKQL